MSDSLESFVEVTKLEISKLEIKPGEFLAMICPETWTSKMMAQYGAYMQKHLEGLGIKMLVFPFGTELMVVKPPEGFGQ